MKECVGRAAPLMTMYCGLSVCEAPREQPHLANDVEGKRAEPLLDIDPLILWRSGGAGGCDFVGLQPSLLKPGPGDTRGWGGRADYGRTHVWAGVGARWVMVGEGRPHSPVCSSGGGWQSCERLRRQTR